MKVEACRGCKRLFNYLAGEYLCPECRKQKEEISRNAKQDVEEEKTYSVCQNCGKSILSGNLCHLCKKQLVRGIENALKSDMPEKPAPKPQTNGSSQMRFLSQRKK